MRLPIAQQTVLMWKGHDGPGVVKSLWIIQSKKWSRSVQKIGAIPYLFMIPFGTVYAMVAFLKLNQKEANSYFLPGKFQDKDR